MSKYLLSLVVILALMFSQTLFGQVENVPLTHPVYPFLKHLHIKGLIPGKSFFRLPFTKKEIQQVLLNVYENPNELNGNDKKLLEDFLVEFELKPKENAVFIPSKSDSLQVISLNLFSNKDKYIYHFLDEKNSVAVKPLGSLRTIYKLNNGTSENALYGNLGFRVYGTIDTIFGYYIQATNGTIFSGSRELGIHEDKTLANSIKFTLLNSDFDLVESHIRYQKDWFFAGLSRETRFLGSGVYQNLVISDNAPPMDEFYAGVSFKNFKYTFSHFGLVAEPKDSIQFGADANIPQKFMVLHSATLQFRTWNLTYFQSIVYSGRGIEIAYLNPFTFLKSVEHSLRDRDKASLGFAFEWNFLPNFQAVGTWMLEDLMFSMIGKNYWSNKTAWNIGILYSSEFSTDFGLEYTRVEPYMFTHFNRFNNRTNDGRLFGTYLYPNSDEVAFLVRNFAFGRYPAILRISYQRHGENETDSTGRIIRNVGGDFRYVHTPSDSYYVTFLDGIRNDLFRVQFTWGFEIIRNFNFQLSCDYRKYQRQKGYFVLRFVFRFEDF